MNQLTLKNIEIFYKDDERIILRIPDLTIDAGLNFIIGDNGTGKSTFLKALTNHHPNIGLNGDLYLNGKHLNRGASGLVNQNPSRSISLELTFLENLGMSLFDSNDFLSLKFVVTSTQVNRINDFLKYYSLAEKVQSLLHKPAGNLSIGQQQLLAILMRLLRFRDILLLDEATANLDPANSQLIIGILLEIVKKGTIVIFATHQMQLIESEGSKIFNTRDGKLSRIEKVK